MNNPDKLPLQQRVIIVTGPSGAGRSTAISALEDSGYEAIDNIPLSLISPLLASAPKERGIVFGIDARNRDFSPNAVLDLLEQLSEQENLLVECVYLDCHPDTLLRRFSETRRRHPLTPTGSPEQGIAEELALLAPIRAIADILLETTDLSPHDLKFQVCDRLHPENEKTLAVTVQSFSFKRGMPRGLDLAFDVRFLRNPHWVSALAPLNGTDKEVADYIRGDDKLAPFEDKLLDMISFLLPSYESEGKAHLLIGIGCTGGQHRSVFLTENLGKALANLGWQVSIRHRELLRRAQNGTRTTGV